MRAIGPTVQVPSRVATSTRQAMIRRGELKAPSTMDVSRSQGHDLSVSQGQKRGRIDDKAGGTYGKGCGKGSDSWKTHADELSERAGAQIQNKASNSSPPSPPPGRSAYFGVLQ